MSLHLAIDTLAARITNNAKVISTFCEQSAHLTPAVGEPSSAGILPFDAPESVQRARHTLLETSYELQKLSSEPSEYLEQQQIHVRPCSTSSFQVFDFKILCHLVPTPYLPSVVAPLPNPRPCPAHWLDLLYRSCRLGQCAHRSSQERCSHGHNRRCAF